MTTTPTILFCDKQRMYDNSGEYFANFYPSKLQVQMCRSHNNQNAPMLKARVSEGKDIPGSYWAWWGIERQAFTMVFRRKFIVEMCFPYGTKVEEERGRGKLLPVDIEIIGEELS